jgi:hypothetical protein
VLSIGIENIRGSKETYSYLSNDTCHMFLGAFNPLHIHDFLFKRIEYNFIFGNIV